MRTIQQQVNEVAMFVEIKSILSRSSSTFLEDAFGVASLFLLLFAGLTLSGAA